MTGIKYWNGQMESTRFVTIPGVQKRGLWRFEVPEDYPVQRLDNGVTLDVRKTAELMSAKKDLFVARRSQMEYREAANA